MQKQHSQSKKLTPSASMAIATTTTTKPIVTYITLEDCCDFRRIARIMSKAGYTMNHATARNTMMIALSNFLTNLAKNLGIAPNEANIQRLVNSSEIHAHLQDVLQHIYLTENITNQQSSLCPDPIPQEIRNAFDHETSRTKKIIATSSVHPS